MYMNSFSQFLLLHCSYISKIKPVHKNNESFEKCAVIIEPRKHPMLESVIRNVMHYLGDGWNLHVWTTPETDKWLHKQLPGWEFKVSHIPFSNLNQQLYNGYLLDKIFWHEIREEHIVIFQSDCVMFRSGIESYLGKYDYVGANYYNSAHQSPLLGGIQGGFSLRKRSAMLDILERVTWNDIDRYRASYDLPILSKRHEDIFFTHACEILQKEVVPASERKAFAIEAEWYDRPIAHHGFQHPYFTPEQVAKIICQSEDYEVLSKKLSAFDH